MIIYLLRHTKPNVPNDTFYGHTDIDVIQEDFEKNAPRLKKFLPLDKLDKVISSPLQRCYKLACEFTNHQVPETDERLMELNFGDWEMQNWNKIDRNKIKAWTKNFVTAEAPNGESHYQLYQRVTNFWNELLEKNYKKVCIVTHAGVIRALLAHVLEMPIRKGFSIKLHYNELIRVDHIENSHYNVEFITNENWER
jgi:alpha-ribazole phosphatase